MWRRIFHIALICLFALSLNAQSVGLVLSGGGAKGIAHIGVIKVLEENNIPIDFIAGTSMGAVIGALYASGYSPDEMLEIVTSDDFKQWTRGDINICDQYYYKNMHNTPAWFDISIGRKNGELKTQLPTNLYSPAQMDLRFLHLFGPSAACANYDFNNLMIPFFCIATDVYHNQPVILKKGNLSSAVRASMTFPGYIKPITIDSILLFDGGMENNFPVDICIEQFNPDYIIGSKVAFNPPKPDEDDVYQQLLNVFMKPTNYIMPPNGILIEPKVKTYDVTDIEHCDTIWQLGVNAAEILIDSILKTIPSRRPTSTTKQLRTIFKQKHKPIIFNSIEITGVNLRIQRYTKRSIMRNRNTITLDEFEDEYFKLLSDQLIEDIYPTMKYDQTTGYYTLYLKIKTKTTFNIEVGGNLSSNLSSMGYIGINYGFQHRHIYHATGNTYLGKFYNSVSGKFRIEFPPRYQKNSKAHAPLFIDIGSTYNKWDYFALTSKWTIDSDAPTEVLQRESNFMITLGNPIKTRGILSLTSAIGQTNDEYYHTNTISTKDLSDKTIFNYLTINLTYEYNTLNLKQYSNRGRQVNVSAGFINGTEDYSPGTTAQSQIPLSSTHKWFNVKFDFQQYIRTCKYFTIALSTNINYSNKSSFSNSMSALLSSTAYTPFPQSTTVFLKNFRSYSWAGCGLSPIIHITNRIDYRTEIFLFQPHKYILTNTYNPEYSEAFPLPKIMAMSGVIYHTALGPLALTGCYFMDEETEYYFQLSFGYILFNKRGFD